MFVFGFGITTDVEDIRYASLDLDQTPESRSYLEAFAGSRYFLQRPPLYTADQMKRRLEANDISLAIEIPPLFGRDLRRGGRPEVSALVDGANPLRAETIKQYVAGVHGTFLRDPAQDIGGTHSGPNSADIQVRYLYNPTFESIYAIVPSVPAIVLV